MPGDGEPGAVREAGNIAARRELRQRLVSGLVLATIALGSGWLGGALFSGVWAVAAWLLIAEWMRLIARRPVAPPLALVARRRLVLFLAAAGLAVLAVSGADAISAHAAFGLAGGAGIIIAGAILLPSGVRAWGALGLAYGLSFLAAVLLVRDHGFTGWLTLGFIFAIVWSTDIGAFFVGRFLGGPRLWPRLSPNKTWSGMLGGISTGTAAGFAWLAISGLHVGLAHALVAFTLALAAVAGDLFESHLKRRFDAKDAGTFIPGHGGLLDRLDSFVFATILAALLGWWHTEGAGIPEGVIAW